jgi:hypothetical protein
MAVKEVKGIAEKRTYFILERESTIAKKYTFLSLLMYYGGCSAKVSLGLKVIRQLFNNKILRGRLFEGIAYCLRTAITKLYTLPAAKRGN